MKTESQSVQMEILKKREKLGWYALGATALLGIILVATEAPEILKAILFVPAFIGGLAFLQSWFRFIIPTQYQELYALVKFEKNQKLSDSKQKLQSQARLLVFCSVIIALLITASAFST